MTNEMFQHKRPKPGEDEGDILAQEKEFLAKLRSGVQQHGQSGQSFEPAAKVVKQKKPQDIDKDVTQEKPSRSINDVNRNEPMDKMEDDGGVEDPGEIVIQENVLERNFDVSKLLEFNTPKPRPLPTVGNENATKSLFAKGFVLPSTKRTGKSLFAQMFDATYDVNTQSGSVSTSDEPTNSLSSSGSGGCKPVIGDKIHPYLAGMTQADIMEEQKKLVDRLDPRLVEFVRSRQTKKELVNLTPGYELGAERPARKRDADMTNLASASNNISVDESELPIDPKTVRDIPGMGKLETEKLEWTGVVKENRKTFDKLEDGESARFDFDGLLLTGQDFDSKETFEKGLHHHGQDMEKPGYTLEELLTLARSSNHQQKARALQIIGNIYVKAHTGDAEFTRQDTCLLRIYKI